MCDGMCKVSSGVCEQCLPLSSSHGAFGEAVVVVLSIFLPESITAELIVIGCDVAARDRAPAERVQPTLRAVNTHGFIQ